MSVGRIEAGLLQTIDDEVEENVKGATNLSEEQEKALKKKEQERRRRENKKQKGKKKSAEVESSQETSNNNEANAKPSKSKESNIRQRITELLRGGCSGEVFAESSFSFGGKRILSQGEDGIWDSNLEQSLAEEGGVGHRRSRICLNMVAGLQVFDIPSSPEWVNIVEIFSPI